MRKSGNDAFFRGNSIPPLIVKSPSRSDTTWQHLDSTLTDLCNRMLLTVAVLRWELCPVLPRLVSERAARIFCEVRSVRCSSVLVVDAVCRLRTWHRRRSSVPMSTADRLLEPGWWPTKGTEPRELLRGSAACATCHAESPTRRKQLPWHSAAMTADRRSCSRSSGITSAAHFHVGTYSYELAQPKPSSTLFGERRHAIGNSPVSAGFSGAAILDRLTCTSRRARTTKAT